METPIYNSFEEKNPNFCYIYNIDSQEDLDKLISNYQENDSPYLFRGVNNACFKLYSSSQVQWMLTDACQRKSQQDYFNFIVDCIRNTRKHDCVQDYIKKNNIPDNDLFILALMQHYGIPSPVLDFSHSILGALFFAYDKCDRSISSTGNQISDYTSLYVINHNIDWFNYSVQKLLSNSSVQINDSLSTSTLFKTQAVDTSDVEFEFQRIPYNKFKDFSFITVDDNPQKAVDISIPILNLKCQYRIINDRILSQKGMFVANNTVDTPLVELMNDWCKQKYFCCFNIRKNLLDYLNKTYLDPNGINDKTMYCREDSESNDLDNELTNIRNRVIGELKNI